MFHKWLNPALFNTFNDILRLQYTICKFSFVCTKEMRNMSADKDKDEATTHWLRGRVSGHGHGLQSFDVPEVGSP